MALSWNEGVGLHLVLWMKGRHGPGPHLTIKGTHGVVPLSERDTICELGSVIEMIGRPALGPVLKKMARHKLRLFLKLARRHGLDPLLEREAKRISAHVNIDGKREFGPLLAIKGGRRLGLFLEMKGRRGRAPFLSMEGSRGLRPSWKEKVWN